MTMTEADPTPVVLIVEDDPYLRDVMRRGLESLLPDWTFVAAPNGTAALAAIAAQAPTLVITDYNMPSMDGIELIRAIKTAVPQARALLVSVLDTPALERRARAAGAGAVLGKPFKLAELAAVVRELIAERGQG
jgi:CheY-like chemotaxis protein